MQKDTKIVLISVIVIIGAIIAVAGWLLTSSLPIYPGAKLDEEMSEEGKRTLERYQIKDCEVKYYTTSDEPIKVLNFYKEEMKKTGWELRDEKDVGNYVAFLYKSIKNPSNS